MEQTGSKVSHWKAKNNSVDIFVSRKIYPYEPIFATCCVFLDKYYILIDLDEKKEKYIVNLTAQKSGNKKINAKKIANSFFNELVSNTLRYQIALRNQKVREYIVREALFFSRPKKEQEKVIQRLTRKK